MNKERVLVIGAHCDDESFGCLGTLLEHKKAGDKIEFLSFTSARNTLNGFIRCAQYFDSHYAILNYKDQEYDSYPIKKFILDVECWVNTFKPTIVYFPFIADLNRDHRIISEASMVALRPYKFKNAPLCLMYETPGSTELGLRPFVPDHIEQIDQKKKKALLSKWYPGEMINGRSVIMSDERFERWPR